jgi:hypothetical protein
MKRSPWGSSPMRSKKKLDDRGSGAPLRDGCGAGSIRFIVAKDELVSRCYGG